MIKPLKTALSTFAAVCLVSTSLAGCSQTARAPGQYGGTGVGQNYGTNYSGTNTAGNRNMAGTGYGSNVGYNTGYGYNGTGNGFMGMNRTSYNGTSLGNQLGIGNNTGYGTTGYGTTGNRTGYGTTGYGMTGNRTGYGTTPYGTNAGFGYTGYGSTGHGTNTNMGYTGFGTNNGTTSAGYGYNGTGTNAGFGYNGFGANTGTNRNTAGNMGTNIGMNNNNGINMGTVGTGIDSLRSSALRRHVLATKGVRAAEVIVVGDTALVGIKTTGTVSSSRCKAAVSKKVKAADTSIRKVKVSDATDILHRMRRLSTNLTGTTSNNFNTEFSHLVGASNRR
ncbi:MAG TPA: YhcN/YlaJ family sporulation lipoprotein [Clostridia bacterium]|nr:YhcN/YlaJ family sporulation lipoprotein [Clostridia bacterium]